MDDNLTSWFKDYDRLLEDLKTRTSTIKWLESTICIVINLLTLVSNGLTLKIILCNSSQRILVSNYLIASLAIADLCLAPLNAPFILGVSTCSRWPYSDSICQLDGFFALTVACASVLNLTLMAINRYFRIVKSTKYRLYFTTRRTVGYIVVVWILAMIGAALYIASGHSFVFHPGKLFCYLNIEDYIFLALLVTFYSMVPAIIITFCYYKVYKVIQNHNNSMANSRLGAQEINITKSLFLVVVMFMICWSPVFIVDIIDAVRLRWSLPREAYVAYTFFSGSSTFINPILYGIMNPTFRQEYLRLLRCCLCCRFSERPIAPVNPPQ